MDHGRRLDSDKLYRKSWWRCLELPSQGCWQVTCLFHTHTHLLQYTYIYINSVLVFTFLVSFSCSAILTLLSTWTPSSLGLKRTGKSCRLRWLNYLRPDVRRGNITPEEQLLIMELHAKWGNRYAYIYSRTIYVCVW